MTVIDFNKEKEKRAKKPENNTTTMSDTYIYYVVSQTNAKGYLVGYNASFVYVPNHQFSSLDVATLKYLKDYTLKLAQMKNKDIDNVTIINVIPLGVETPENNYNIWKNNDD